MKRFSTTLILVFASSLALALPAPKDIDAAVKAGQLSQAETMLHEVIREKPGSAKAHYELGQVLAREGRNAEAKTELLEAQRLDPSLKFATDPQRFRDLLNKIPAGTKTSPGVSPAVKSFDNFKQVTPAAQAGVGDFPWTWVALGGGILLIVWLLVRRIASASPLRSASAGGSVAAGGYGPGPGGYGSTTSYGPSPLPPQPGSGMGGAVMGGLAGLAAGYGLAKVLENDHTEGHRAQSVDDNSGFIPIDTGAQPDYGNFDSGSGDSDSWDDGGTSSSGDDNW